MQALSVPGNLRLPRRLNAELRWTRQEVGLVVTVLSSFFDTASMSSCLTLPCCCVGCFASEHESGGEVPRGDCRLALERRAKCDHCQGELCASLTILGPYFLFQFLLDIKCTP